MAGYIHKVHYYETDKMGIAHHANYIRWMEEARVQFLEDMGYSYAWLEREGIFSPVIGVECQYRQPTAFDDNVEIDVSVEEFKGVRLVVAYTMRLAGTGTVVLTGKSRHCFTDTQGRPVILKKKCPAFDALLRSAAERRPE